MRTRVKLAAAALGGAAVLIPMAAVPASAQAGGTVQTGGPDLNIRDCAGFSCNIVGSLPDGTQVDIYCQATGDWVYGNWGWTNIWDQIQPNYDGAALVSDGFVYTGSDGFVAPACH